MRMSCFHRMLFAPVSDSPAQRQVEAGAPKANSYVQASGFDMLAWWRGRSRRWGRRRRGRGRDTSIRCSLRLCRCSIGCRSRRRRWRTGFHAGVNAPAFMRRKPGKHRVLIPSRRQSASPRVDQSSQQNSRLDVEVPCQRANMIHRQPAFAPQQLRPHGSVAAQNPREISGGHCMFFQQELERVQ